MDFLKVEWRLVDCPGPGVVAVRKRCWLFRDNYRWLKVIGISLYLATSLYVEYWYHVILGRL